MCRLFASRFAGVFSFVCRFPTPSGQGFLPLLCAAPPSAGSSPLLSECRSLCYPPLCAGSYEWRELPQVSFLSRQKLGSPQWVPPPLSPVCRSPPPPPPLVIPLCVQDSPQRVVPPLSRLCVQVPLSVQVDLPPFYAGFPSVGSSSSRHVVNMVTYIIYINMKRQNNKQQRNY